jgi:hypothetical protein
MCRPFPAITARVAHAVARPGKGEIIMSAIQTSTYLRRVLLLDAASCTAMGLLLLGATSVVSGLTQLPAGLLSEASMVLLPFAVLLAVLATRPRLPRLAVWAVIVVNGIWVIDSVVLLFSGWVQPTLLGHGFVVCQAVFVAVIATLEYLGLRRSPPVAATHA